MKRINDVVALGVCTSYSYSLPNVNHAMHGAEGIAKTSHCFGNQWIVISLPNE